MPANLENSAVTTGLEKVSFHSNPMDCSTPSLPVHHQLPELAQTHVHQVGDAFHHLVLSYSLILLPSVFPSIRVFSSESALCIRLTKY